jgi:pyruvate/2-oxoacid:ferredoxin oxidoreductase beta subunit
MNLDYLWNIPTWRAFAHMAAFVERMSAWDISMCKRAITEKDQRGGVKFVKHIQKNCPVAGEFLKSIDAQHMFALANAVMRFDPAEFGLNTTDMGDIEKSGHTWHIRAIEKFMAQTA